MISLRYCGTAAAILARTNALIHSTNCFVKNSLMFHRQVPSRLASSSSKNNSNGSSSRKTITAPWCPLPFTELPYRGASIDMDSLENPLLSDEALLDLLSLSIPILASHDFNSCWLRIPIHRSAVVASASADLGFELHHVDTAAPAAEGGRGSIVMKKWLRDETEAEDKIPPYPNTQVGCAGLVLSEGNELLLVKEWSGPLSNRTQSATWKLPGGELLL